MTRIADLCVCVTRACLLGLLHPLRIFEMAPLFGRSVKRLRYRFSGNAVQGYKGFRADMTCNGMQYKENGEFIHKGSPCLCRSVFHFCRRLTDVFNYYNEGADVYCPVTAFGSVAGPCNSDKQCTDAIRTGKRLTPLEIYDILLQENQMLPKDHKTIDLVYARNSEREYFHRRLELVFRWAKRAENYKARLNLERKGGGGRREAEKGVVRIKGRLRRR